MDADDRIFVGELEVRPRERAVFVADRAIALTPGEFEIVLSLASHPGWVYSAGQLAGDATEGEEHSPESVSVLVSRVRQKLSSAGLTGAIETVRGFGYRLRPGVGESEPVTEQARVLRDAAWRLQEAVMEAEHVGTPEQLAGVAAALDQARHTIFTELAK